MPIMDGMSIFRTLLLLLFAIHWVITEFAAASRKTASSLGSLLMCVCWCALVETDSDSEEYSVDPWINRRQPVIYRKKHQEHRQVLSASPASDDHESLLHSDQLEKCVCSRLLFIKFSTLLLVWKAYVTPLRRTLPSFPSSCPLWVPGL